jgi:serine/threonine protein kinase
MKPSDDDASRQPPSGQESPKSVASWYAPGISDGIGDRLLMFDNTSAPSLELLRFRREFSGTSGFEAALRQRVDVLRHFRHPAFARVRAVQRLESDNSLALISNYTPGQRLSEVIDRANGVELATTLVRQLVPVLVELHQQGPGIAHGAIGPDRIVVTPDGRLVIVEHVLGAALERLNLPAERLRGELGFAIPAAVNGGPVPLDRLGDLVQLAFVALSLLLGRRVSAADYPHKIGTLLDAFAERHPDGARLPTLRTWLERALQLGGNTFETAVDAEHALADLSADRVAAVPRSLPAPSASPAEVVSQAPEPPRPEPGIIDAIVEEVATPAPAAAAAAPAGTARLPTVPPPLSDRVGYSPQSMVDPRSDFFLSEEDLKPRGRDRTAADHTGAADPGPAAAPGATAPASPSAVFDFHYASAPAVDPHATVAAPKKPSPDPRESQVRVPATGPSPQAPGSVRPPTPPLPIIRSARRSRAPYIAAVLAAISVLEAAVIGALLYERARSATVVAQGAAPGLSGVDGVSRAAQQEPRPSSPSGTSGVLDTTPPTVPEPPKPAPATAAPPPVSPKPVPASKVASGPPLPPRSGEIRLTAPIELQVFEGGRFIGTSGPRGIIASAGVHDLELVNTAVGYRSRQTVELRSGQRLSLGVSPPAGRVSINAVPWAEVWIDGTPVGETPLGNVAVPIGEHEFLFRHPQLGDRRQTAVVRSDGLTRVSANLQQK